MKSLLLSVDLLFSSKIISTAKEQDWSLETASTCEAVVQQAGSTAVKLVLIDLTTPNLDMRSLVSQLRQLETPPSKIIAFGPHVHQKKLADASESGCDEVFTRGQMNQQLPEIFSNL